MLYKTFRGAAHSFYYIAGRRFPPHLNFICIYLFIADGYPVDRLFDYEAVLRVRHCIFIIFCNFWLTAKNRIFPLKFRFSSSSNHFSLWTFLYSLGVIPVDFLNTVWKYAWLEKQRWVLISDRLRLEYLRSLLASLILLFIMKSVMFNFIRFSAGQYIYILGINEW